MKCLNKITLNDGNQAPCGWCDICRSLNKMDWQFRLEQEMKTASTAIFPTLTYAPGYIPLTQEGM